MKISDFINLFKFQWNEEKNRMVKDVSIKELKEILNFFGVDNNSEHDVYIHGFADWYLRDYIFENGLKFFDAYNLQSTLHLLANTEDFAKPYAQLLAEYTCCMHGNAIIGVIPESVGNLYLGKSDRQLNSEFIVTSSIYDMEKVPFIYSTVGNQNTQYCPYDALSCKDNCLVSELILGAMSFIGKIDDMSEDENLNEDEKLFSLEINPQFVLFDDYIQDNGLTNLESLRKKIIENLKEKVFADYFDLEVVMSDLLVNVINLASNPNFVTFRDEYVAKLKQDGFNV